MNRSQMGSIERGQAETERLQKLIESNAKAIEANSERGQAETERLQKLIESNAKAIEANSAASADNRQQINILAEASGRTLRAVDSLREIVEEERVNFQEYRERNEANLVSLNAAVERLVTIVAYLVRRDAENLQS